MINTLKLKGHVNFMKCEMTVDPIEVNKYIHLEKHIFIINTEVNDSYSN